MGNRPSRSKVAKQQQAAVGTMAPPPKIQIDTASVTVKPQKPVLEELSFFGQKLHLDTATDTSDIINQLGNKTGIHRFILSGNTVSVAAAKSISAALLLQDELEEVNLSDCFTGRLKEEVPLALEAFGSTLKQLPRLHTIDMSDNALGPAGARAVATFLPKCSSLKHLFLNNNGLGPEGGGIIAQALLDLKAKGGDLVSLTIGRNRLENDSSNLLAAAIKAHSATLQSVRLFQNGIRPEGISVLFTTGLSECHGLCTIDMQDNTFTASASRLLAEAIPNWPQLAVLNVGDCLLGATGSRTILQSLVGHCKEHPGVLTTLNLQYAEMDEQGAQYLFDHLLPVASGLTLLQLNGNAFNPEGRAGLAIRASAGNILDEWDDMECTESEEESTEESEEEGGEEPAVASVKVVPALTEQLQDLSLDKQNDN